MLVVFMLIIVMMAQIAVIGMEKESRFQAMELKALAAEFVIAIIWMIA